MASNLTHRPAALLSYPLLAAGVLVLLIHGCATSDLTPETEMAPSAPDARVMRADALLRTGQLKRAAALLEEVAQTARRSADPADVAAFLDIRYRYLLGGRRWQQALLAEPRFRTGDEIVSLLHAQGLAAAFLGRAEDAEQRLRVLTSMITSMGLSERYRIELHEIAAGAAMAAGDEAEVHSRMRAAIRLEDPWVPHAELPPPITARELYGEMLLLLGDPEAADEQFARVVDAHRRPSALSGRGKAAAARGDDDTAVAHFRAFLDACADADPEFPPVAEARRFLADK